MEIPITQLPPGDPRLVDVIVGQLKSKGIFDQLRKECLADVDTKPAFLNLRQRVDGQVKKFLGTTIWKNDLNKNQLRDGVRKNIQESGILDAGIDAIINQVVTPKIKTLILPYVESTVYAFLQIEKPKREIKDYDVQQPIYMEPPPVYAYGNPVPMSYPTYENPPVNIPKHEDSKFTSEIYHNLPEKVEPVASSESDISVGGKSPMECESLTQPISDVLPMETDAISSEEDDILSRKSPAHAAAQVEPGVKIDEDNAVDSFDTARGTSDVVSRVEKMNIKEDPVTESTDLKDAEMSKTSAGHLFDHQSLDSISSNSSGLSFSPPAIKKQSPLSNNDSQDSTKFPKNKSEDDLRSTQSTPLIDEKSPLNESITSSENSKAWAPYTLPKDLSSGDKLTFDTAGSTNEPCNVIGGVSPVSTETSQNSMETRSIEKETSTAHTEESQDSKVKSEKSEGEVTSSSSSSSSSLSSPEPNKSSDSKEKISQDSNSSQKDKPKYYSHSRDGDKTSSKKSKHHSRSRSKSKHDDHSSHRDKDKYYRRDKDDDKDKDRHSSSKSHHRTSLSTAATTSKSISSTNESSKDKKERSSDHQKSHSSSHSKHSSKSGSSRRESKDEDRHGHTHKGSASSRKSDAIDKKSEIKSHHGSNSKSKPTSVLSVGKTVTSVTDQIKERKNVESKNKRILKEDETFLLQLTKFSSVQKSKVDVNLEKSKFKKNDSVLNEKSLNVSNDKDSQSIDKIKITLNKATKNGEIKPVKNDSKLHDQSDGKVTKAKIQIGTSESKAKKREDKIKSCDDNEDKKLNVKPAIKKDSKPKKNDEPKFVITLKSTSVDSNKNCTSAVNEKSSVGLEHKKLSFANNLVLEYDNSSSIDSFKKTKVSKTNTTDKRNHKNSQTPTKTKSLKKNFSKNESSSDSSSSSYGSSDSEYYKSKKKVSNVSRKLNSSVVTESASSDESAEETNNVILQKVTIPIFSFGISDNKKASPSKKNKVEPKRTPSLKRKKSNISDQDLIFETSSNDSEFEGFGNIKSPRVKRRLKSKIPLSNSFAKQIIDSDSSDMDISISQFCKSKQSKLNDFEGFGNDINSLGDQSSADQKLKYYLSKYNADSCIELDDFYDSESDVELADTTVFASSNSYLNNNFREIEESTMFSLGNSIPLVTIEENTVESSASDNDSGQSSMDTASSTKFFYSTDDRSADLNANIHDDEDDVTVFSSNCDAKDIAIQSTSESSIDSINTTSDNYYQSRRQVICNLGNHMVIPVSSETPKRKLSECSNGNGTPVFPISKKRRILNAVQSEMEENMAKDNVIINSYSILTPEEDRTGSKEYDVDLSQRVNTYCPLSPASDSSAEDLKSKNQGKDAAENDHNSSIVKET